MRVLICLWISCCVCSVSFAEETKPAAPEPSQKIYQKIGPNGEIILTDQPSPGAKEIDVPPANKNVYTPQPLPDYTPSQTNHSSTRDDDEVRSYNYTSFVMSSPTNEETIWANEGGVTLQVSLTPELSGNHSLLFVVDGKSMPANGLSLTLDDIERGEHKIHAEIRDGKNAIVQSTPEITIYVRRPTVKN